jgi:TRAP-type uncharacterized transport system fused permease subunit
LKEGWFYLLPPFVIIVVLMNGYGVPYSGLVGILSVIVLAGLKGTVDLFRNSGSDGISTDDALGAIGRGIKNIIGALETGAIRSLPICAAVGAVGLVMGTLFQTGLGLKFSVMMVTLAGDNMFLAIILIGLASFVLGMGLPTSAAYIVLSVMAVPALLEIGEPWALSLLGAHLIVFWFSLDSCFTPPVCVPAYTAAGIAQANPNKAAWAAFRTAKGMYVVPVMFAFTPILLLDQPVAVLQTMVAGVFGFLALGAAIVGFMYVKVEIPERLILCTAALGMFWPSLMIQIAGGAILAIVFMSQRSRYAKIETTIA